MVKATSPRIAILGAGPIGLEAALYARTLGYPVEVFEAGQPGEHVARWGHVRLFSPFGMNSTPLGRSAIRAQHPRHELPGESECTTGREHLTAYLQPLVGLDLLKDCIRPRTRVLHIGRQGLLKEDGVGEASRGRPPFLLLLLEENKRERLAHADIVLDCTGTYGQHRWLGHGGIPALGELAAQAHIGYGLDDVLGERKGHYAGKSILVVGAGFSAATTVCNLAQLAEKHPETWVTWLARGPATQPIRRIGGDPLKERDRLAVRANTLATRTDHNVEFHPQTVVEAIDSPAPDQGFKVTTRRAGQVRSWQVDRVIANVGYTPNTGMYRELQVHECYATLGPIKLAANLLSQRGADCLKITSPGPEALRNPEPGFFILGSKSFGRNSQFLLRLGFEQVRDVFQLISSKHGLDLYKNA
jgi:thioredoxin reductase